jgi:hypothetical protein
MRDRDALDLACQFFRICKRCDVNSQAFSIEIYDGRLKLLEVFYLDVDLEASRSRSW